MVSPSRRDIEAHHAPVELGNGRLCLADGGELHDADALGAAVLEEDLGLVDHARRLEELHQVLVRRRPRQLQHVCGQHSQPKCALATLTFLTKICWLGSAGGSATAPWKPPCPP